MTSKATSFRQKYRQPGVFSACATSLNCLSERSHQRWPVRLSVRTPGFQPGKRGSIPLRAASLQYFVLVLRGVYPLGLPRRVGCWSSWTLGDDIGTLYWVRRAKRHASFYLTSLSSKHRPHKSLGTGRSNRQAGSSVACGVPPHRGHQVLSILSQDWYVVSLLSAATMFGRIERDIGIIHDFCHRLFGFRIKYG